MYYVTDPYHPELEKQLLQAVVRQQQKYQPEGITLHVYAVLDGAMDEAWGHTLWQASHNTPDGLRAVYQGTPLADAEEAGLFVGDLQQAHLKALLSKAKARPMLSFVQSALGLEQFCLHLSQFSRGQTSDQYWYVLRWGCPNRVPDLLSALREAHRASLLDGMAAWHLIHRSGNIHSIEGTMGLTHPAAGVPGFLDCGVPLSDVAVDALMRAGEADLILAGQLSELPHEIRGRSAVALHHMTQTLLHAMNKKHITSHPQRVQLVLEGLQCNSAEAALALVEATAP